MKSLRSIPLIIAAAGLICSCSHIYSPKPGSQKAEKDPSYQGETAPGAPQPAEDGITRDGPPGIVPAATYPQTSQQGETEDLATVVATDPSTDGPLPEGAKEVNIPDKEEQTLLDEALDFCEVAQSFWQKGELDNALDALDKAYSLILGVDTLENVKLIQQKEDLRYLISKRILEIYASRNIVVNGNHDEIPMEMNAHVQNELKRFTGFEKSFFEASYARSGQYRPYILEALRNAGLPEELSWLPLIESGFKVKALSRARALGLWQFIPSTGYKFGLKRNKYIDERIDFVKATDAAIAYLKELHSIFGDWATVLAAYNCGEGRVFESHSHPESQLPR